MATTAPTFQSEKEKITVTNKSRDSKKLKIEGIDAVGILNSIRPVSEPLKEIPRVENTTETNESNNRRTALDIDEVRCWHISKRIQFLNSWKPNERRQKRKIWQVN